MSSRRERICRGKGKKRFCVYVLRNKKGQIKKVTNIGRSINADKRIKAKRKLTRGKDRGRGHLGDFRKKRR